MILAIGGEKDSNEKGRRLITRAVLGDVTIEIGRAHV